MKISKRTKGKITKAAALTLDVGAPLIATISQFPVWVERSAGSTVSGIFVVFALLCSIPAFKSFGKLIQSPSAYILWGILLGLFIALRTIVDEMILICGVGLAANLIGAAIYKVGEGLDREEKQNG